MNRVVLKSLRESSGLSQHQLAKKANITRSYYGLIENGKRNPSLLNAQKIAQSLNVGVMEAFPGEFFFGEKCYDMKPILKK